MRDRVLSSRALLWSVGCRGGADWSTPVSPPEVTVAEVRAEDLAEWDALLSYVAVRSASMPSRVLLAFFQSTYEASAALGGWDQRALERDTTLA